MKSLCVEGWRFLHHSYAVVNQWQLLSLLKRNDISLSVCDLPYFRSTWKPQHGLFNPDQERKIASVPTLDPKEVADATLRISYPFDFSLRPEGRTVLFATSEFHCIPPGAFKAPADIQKLSQSESFLLVTPSHWSREGFLRLGLRPDQVVVVPHGVDPVTFQPSSGRRKAVRDALKLEGFTFANASSMTANKGIDLLLHAFAIITEGHPDARLMLKGADDLYRSHQYLQSTLARLPDGMASKLEGRILYGGNAVTMEAMSEFYQAADVYVSPYRGEGFNLPVLEASASGTPVICTKGGSTDEFMNNDTALFIDSRVVEYISDNVGGYQLEPNLDHLVHQMLRVMEDNDWRKRAAHAGAHRAATEFNWDLVVNKLLDAVYVGHEKD